MADENKKENNNVDENSENSEIENSENENNEEQNNYFDKNKVVPRTTFTQDEVNRIIAKEKRQNFNSFYNDLGINGKDTEKIKMVKNYISSMKTEKEEKEEQANLLKQAEERAKIAETKAEIMMFGIKAQYAEDAVTLVLNKLKADENAEIKTILSGFKSKYPLWFTVETEGENNSVGKNGTGSSINLQTEKSGEKKGLGQRLAAKRKGNTKSVYWKK